MSEKGETEFFKWKDEIESKFNNLSQKNTELEKKLEFMESEFKCTPKSFSIWVKKCKQNKEQIDDLHKQVNNNATEVDTRFSISETVLQDFMEVIRTYACEEISECIPELQDKLKSYPVQNRIDRLDAGLKILKKHEEWLKDVIPKQAEKKEWTTENLMPEVEETLENLKDFYPATYGCPRCGALLHQCGTNPEKILFLCNKCGHKIIKDSGGEQSVCEGRGTLGANKDGSVTDSKLPELCKCGKSYKSHFIDDSYKTCKYFEPKEKATEPVDDEGFVTGNILPKGVEFYELYLKNKEQYYFKKTTHPFTELNNMVHLGTGEVVATRKDLRELIEAIHEGYGDEQPAMAKFLERIEEAYELNER